MREAGRWRGGWGRAGRGGAGRGCPGSLGLSTPAGRVRSAAWPSTDWIQQLSVSCQHKSSNFHVLPVGRAPAEGRVITPEPFDMRT